MGHAPIHVAVPSILHDLPDPFADVDEKKTCCRRLLKLLFACIILWPSSHAVCSRALLA